MVCEIVDHEARCIHAVEGDHDFRDRGPTIAELRPRESGCRAGGDREDTARLSARTDNVDGKSGGQGHGRAQAYSEFHYRCRFIEGDRQRSACIAFKARALNERPRIRTERVVIRVVEGMSVQRASLLEVDEAPDGASDLRRSAPMRAEKVFTPI